MEKVLLLLGGALKGCLEQGVQDWDRRSGLGRPIWGRKLEQCTKKPRSKARMRHKYEGRDVMMAAIVRYFRTDFKGTRKQVGENGANAVI